MFRPRVIPVLLLRNLGLVKSIKFKDHRYIGDPINAVKIFNDKRADELVFLDINATKENRIIAIDFVNKVGDEANMPFAVGGGIKSIENIRKILENGAEKVIINSYALAYPEFIKEAADKFGKSTIIVCMDVKNNILGKQLLVSENAQKKTKYEPIEFAKIMEEFGAGEIIVQSVDRDGTYQGYDLALVKKISESVSIPVVALGGAKDYMDLSAAATKGFASAVAAGSIFVYHGPRKAVLISYPTPKEKIGLFS